MVGHHLSIHSVKQPSPAGSQRSVVTANTGPDPKILIMVGGTDVMPVTDVMSMLQWLPYYADMV